MSAKELNRGTEEGANRFKYISFVDRVRAIDVDVVRRVHDPANASALLQVHRAALTGGTGGSSETTNTGNNANIDTHSHFAAGLAHWRDTNATAQFSAFLKDVTPLSRSFHELMFNKDEVVAVLVKHLSVSDSQAQEPLVELLSLLAYDLRAEVYPHFPAFVNALAGVLRGAVGKRDAKVIESTFHGLGFLYKYLWKELVRDFQQTFDLVSPFLRDRHPYIRQFAGPGVAFLMRKVASKDQPSTLAYILRSCSGDADINEQSAVAYREGVAQLLAETVKGPRGTFHSKMASVVEGCLALAGSACRGVDDVLAKFVTLVMVHAASADDAAPLIAIINKHIQQSPTSAALWTLLKICVAIRKGDRALASIPAVMDTITVMREAVICSENGATHREYLSTIVVFARILDIKHYTAYRTLIDTILRTASPALATALVKILVDVQWEQFTALLLPAVVAFIDRTFVESPKEMLLLIAYVLRMDAFDGNALSSCVGEGGRLRFAGESIGAYLVDTVANAASNVHSVIQQFNEAGEGALTTVVAALSCIPRVVLARNDDTAWAVVTKLVEATAAHMATSVTLAQQHGRVILFVRSLRASIALAGVHTDKLPCLWPFAISALHACSKNTALLETVHDYMVAVRTAMPAETFSAQAMLMLYSTLKQNLLSPDAALRLVTLRILSIYDAVPYVTADTADPSAIPTQPFFELLLTVERTPNTVECYREKLMHLRRIHSVVVANRQLPFTYVDIVPRFCCGLLTVNFQPVWEDAMKLLMAFGEVLFRSDDGKGVKGNEMLWDIWWTELQRSAEIVEEELSTHDCFALALASDHVDYIEQHDPRSLFGDISVCTITKMSWDASHFFKTSSTGLLNEALLESMASDTTAASRFDRANYHALLMRAVTTYAPKLAEARATSDFVPMFLAFYNGQYEKSHAAVTTLTSGVDVPAPTAPVKFLRKRLVLFLELFGKFRNPSATIKDPAMNFSLATIYHHLLTKNDPQLQRLALECLRTYRNEVVMHYADRLLALIEDATFRDELSALQSDTEIPAHHRHDLLRLVIRILFGKIVRQKAGASVGEGAASMRTVMARRSAVLGFLAGCQEDELRFFVDDLLLAPFNGVCDAHAAGGQFVFAEAACAAMTEVGHRTQIAYLHLLEDLCKQMGAFLSPYLDQMMLVLMYLLRGAQCTIDAGVQVTNPMDVDCNEAEEEEAAAGSTHLLKRAREIRSMALRRLADIFSLKLNNLDADEEGSACAFDFTPYMPALFEHILTPRIRLLAVENTQSPTALLDLLWAWSKSPVYVGYLATYDASLLPALFACLSAVNVKPAVVGRVLDVVEFILAKVEPTGESDLTVGQAILSPHVGALLDHLEQVLVSAPSLQSKGDMVSRDHLVQRQIRILSEMAQFTRKPAQLWRLVDLLLPFLKKSSRQVPEPTKADILQIVRRAIPQWSERPGEHVEPTSSSCYQILALLFSTLKSRSSRRALISAMQEFAELDNTLAPVMSLIGQLHAEPTLRKRLDEDRDWDAVLRAFNEINNNAYKTMRSVDWLPLLHCLVHFCYDQEESTIRGNASYGLCRFVERVAAEVASAESVVGTESMGTFTETDINGPLYNQLIHVVLPSVKRGFKSHELQVRAEFVSVLGRMVTLLPEDPHFYDMVPLLADGDDEASFFSNIYHVQTHRRTRALRRLAEIVAARKEGMSMPTLTTILIPLIGHFAFETDRKSEQQLISDSISALGVMCGQLRWPQYWALIKSYFRLMALKPHLQKMLVRTVLAILDQFHWDLSAVDPAAVQQKQQSVSVVAAAPVVEFDGSNEDVDATAEDTVMEVDEETIMLITEERIFGVLIGKLLPDLFKLLSDHKEGESNMSIRVPIAIGYTKLLMRLPDTTMRIELPRLLTTVAQILRSRGQDVRDATRETLVKMAGILGPKYFQFVVKELAGALRSGYQLHVLGYSLHHLLVQVLPTMAVGDVDPCVDAVTEILLNDIFGEVGAEKDVDALAVKMKECKAKKSFESFELLAKAISFPMLERILLPLRNLMVEFSSTSFTRDAGEVLRRLVLGLNANQSVDRVDFLIFVFQLMTGEGQLFRVAGGDVEMRDNFERNFTVQSLERTDKQIAMRTHFPTNAHLFTEFAHRLFATSLKNERFSPTDPTHVRVLDPLLEVVADALTSKYADVIVQALRALCMLTRFGLPSMGRVLPRCFERCCKLIGRASSTATETVQNCFKLITVILRDCTSGKVKVDIKEQRLLALVNLIRPDLEECDNNSTTFALVKAILGRRVMAVEIYDLMDDVARVMVTNQTPHIREQCRHVLLQFLLDYPLGEKRLERHLLFLVRNLEYIHETGRVSVLELINSICIKFPQEVLDGWVDVLFLALAVRMVNEESAICREMVLALMQTLLRAVSLDRVDAVLKIVVGWRGQPVLQRTLVQCIGVVADAFVDVPDRRPWLRQRYVDDFARMLEDATEEFVQAEQQEEVEDDEEQATNASTQAWKTVYFALTSYGRLVKSYPSIMQDVAHSSVWTSAHTLLTHYHSWVRSAACRLWGAYLTTVDPTTRMFADTGMESFIYDVDAAVHLAESLVAQLCMPALTEEVGLQLVKNLVFMGRLLRAAPVPVDVAGDTEQDDHEENVVEEETVMVQDVFDDAEHETIKSNTRHRQRHPKRLHWLVRRLSFIARGELTTASGTAKRTHVFRWFAAMASVLCSGNGNNVISAAENSADAAAEELAEHAVAMLSPLHRTVVDETKRDEKNATLRTLATEVMHLLSTKLGTTRYTTALSTVQQRITTRRTARKTAQRQLAITDAQAHAERKLARNKGKKEWRKRKNEEFARGKTRLHARKRVRGGFKVDARDSE